MELKNQNKEDQLQDERYDRTIRALTAEVALKLMKSRVLITPLNGVNTEFMKNIVLDGVNVTIFDDSIISGEDVGTNFMFSPTDIGRVKAETLKEKFIEMNPYSKIEAKELLNIHELSKMPLKELTETFKNFDIFVVSTTIFKEMILWDQIATMLNKPLFILNCCGLYGYAWISLGKSFSLKRFKEKVQILNVLDVEEKQNADEGKGQCEEVVINCKSLAESFNANLKGKSTIYYAIHMMYEAEKQNIKLDPFNPKDDILEKVLTLGKAIYLRNKFKYNESTEATLRNFARLYSIEYCPVYSVIGSVASQEFAKVIARNTEPSYNWFCYDSQTGYGKIESSK